MKTEPVINLLMDSTAYQKNCQAGKLKLKGENKRQQIGIPMLIGAVT